MNEEGNTNKPADGGEPAMSTPEPTPTPQSTPTPTLNDQATTSAPATDSSLPNDSAPATAAYPQQPAETKKKPKKPIIIGLIAAIVIALLAGGSTLAYNLWYQNPDKVLADSMTKLVSSQNLSAKANLVIDDNGTQAKVNISEILYNGNLSVTSDINVTEADVKVTLAGNLVYDKKGIVYVKVNNADEILDALLEVQMAEIGNDMTAAEKEMTASLARAMLEPAIKKVNGQWIKITPEDVDEQADSDDQLQCLNDALKTAGEDKSVEKQITTAYRQNAFMVMTEDLGSKNGNIGYRYELDQAKSEKFSDALDQTDIGKAVAKCDKSKDSDTKDAPKTEDSAEQTAMTMELWVNRWTHQLASASINITEGKQSAKLDLSASYDKDIDIAMPTDAITVDELSDSLGGLIQL